MIHSLGGVTGVSDQISIKLRLNIETISNDT
jgi:hypothetical protein